MCAETKKKPSKTAKPSSPTAGPAKTHDTTGAKSDARQSSPRCVTADVTAQAPRPSVAARRVDEEGSGLGAGRGYAVVIRGQLGRRSLEHEIVHRCEQHVWLTNMVRLSEESLVEFVGRGYGVADRLIER